MLYRRRCYQWVLKQRHGNGLFLRSVGAMDHGFVQRLISTAPVAGTSTPEVVKEEVGNVDYPALLQEYNMVQSQVRFFTMQLYRRILRSVHRLLRPGNAFDESEFRKREEKQQSTDPSVELSMVDSLPIDREEELQSRMDYYWQYTREHFTQHSDVLQDIVAPTIRASTTEKSNENTNFSNDRNSRVAWDSDARHREIEAELLLQDQYHAIERYFYLLQQGEVHRQWLLRDMKFPKDPFKPTPEAAAQVTEFKGQFQQYIIRAIQYKCQMPAQWSQGLLDITTSMEDNTSLCGDEPVIWSDEEDEEM